MRWVSPCSLIQFLLYGSVVALTCAHTRYERRRWFWKYANRKGRPPQAKPVSKREWNEHICSEGKRRNKINWSVTRFFSALHCWHYTFRVYNFFPRCRSLIQRTLFCFVHFGFFVAAAAAGAGAAGCFFQSKIVKVLKGTRQHTCTTLFGGWTAFCFLFYATRSCSYFSIHFSPIRLTVANNNRSRGERKLFISLSIIIWLGGCGCGCARQLTMRCCWHMYARF